MSYKVRSKSMARVAVGSSADIPQILLALDQGTVMIKFFKRKRPERRVFCLKTDTFEILQYPMGRGKNTLSEETSEGGRGRGGCVRPGSPSCW